MGMRDLEASILAELRTQAGNRTIRQKDIMEWTTGDVTPRDGELHAFLPMNRVNVCYVLPPKKEKKSAATG